MLFLSVAAVLPLTASGYFPMHDDTQVARVVEMGRSLSEGQFPVRWVRNLGYGYGYPIFNFYAPLPYYFGGALYALGVPALLATKIMFGVGVVAPAIVIAWLLGFPAGIVAGSLYLFAPYHAVQIYVRGAVGEYWSLIFWPVILFVFTRWDSLHKYNRHVLLGSIGIGGVILSHTLLGYVTVLFIFAGLLLYWLIALFRGRFVKKDFLLQLLAVWLGLGVSAFFWLPAFAEMGFTNVSGQISATAHYADHFVCVSQLWSSVWGFGGSAAGCVDGMSFMLGKIHILLAVLGAIVWMVTRPKGSSGLFVAGLLCIGTGLFFVTEYSRGVWAVVPGFPYLQYPWRFLALVSLGISVSGSFITGMAPKGVMRWIVAVSAALLVAGMSVKWFTPQYSYTRISADFESEADIRWRVSKISDEYLPEDIIRPKDASQAVFGTIEADNSLLVRELENTAIRAHYSVISTQPGMLKINRAYFPGWRYYVDGEEVLPVIAHGLPGIQIGAGKSEISMAFTDTPVRVAGNVLSILSVIVWGGLLYGKQRKTKS